MMSYVPFYAIIARVVFWKYKQFNFTELLVFFLYTQAQFSIVSAFTVPFFAISDPRVLGVIGILAVVFQFGYFFYALKKFYDLSLGKMVLRTLKFLMFMFILFVIVSAAIAFYMHRNGAFDQLKDAQ